MLADPTGYTVDFDLYYGAANQSCSGKGLSHDVVTTLVQPFCFQGYQLFWDNFYSSPTLFTDLYADGIAATGTLKMNRQGVPNDVLLLKAALENKGYWLLHT